MDKNQFYFQGKFFDNDKEMFEYAAKWPNQKLDKETAERLLSTFCKDCVMNIFLLGREMTNGDMKELLDDAFYCFIHKIEKYKSADEIQEELGKTLCNVLQAEYGTSQKFCMPARVSGNDSGGNELEILFPEDPKNEEEKQ